MIVLPGSEAYAQLYRNVRAKTFTIPHKSEAGQYVDGGLFPRLPTSSKLGRTSKVFTIGSCFAREVESVLLDCEFAVPVAGFTIPEGELPFPGPHLLNEYNAGTIIQRLESVTGDFDYGDKGIEFTDKGAIDLFLHVGSAPVSIERLRQRRREIAGLYQQLLVSDVIIITLGLVESWYDAVDCCYLNKAPSQKLVRQYPDRFQFHRMDVEDVYARISGAIEAVLSMGLQRIILTVSPVPIEATFMPDPCVLANGYSKAVLRVCAELISKRYAQVTYFPSYEVATSFGTKGFLEDNIHVQPWVVHHIMHYMLDNLVEKTSPQPESALTALSETAASAEVEAVSQEVSIGPGGVTSPQDAQQSD